MVDEIATGRQAVALLHEMRRGDRPIDDNEEIVLPLALSQGETLAAAARSQIGASSGLRLHSGEEIRS